MNTGKLLRMSMLHVSYGYLIGRHYVCQLSFSCATGYYCLAAQDPIPCRNGTYNNATGMDTESACVDCPVGKYCEGVGNSVPDGQFFSSSSLMHVY